ncbi:potassium transporter 10-like isoform X2 [Andrographis paniculata]|uniref:potassium transporter 10-like isoform X2 n=1 Tax=Andrographis paniculata TaxID=175694 RepID=UPI0021E97692|nr:potassium transporter 10-like isoform X2 [Andrographis paniculata]
MASGEESVQGSETKGSMWVLEQKIDQPMEEEAGRLKNMYREKKFSTILLLRLAFQSLGIVYGDLGTSPLYVFYNTFPDGIEDPEDVIGALSLIIYSLTLVPLLKYVFIVCRANDNGQGGTFALYSLLCRHAKVKIIPNQHRTDEELTTYSRSTFHEHSFAAKTKRWLEADAFRRNALLILVLVGTCMVIGDGILTPAISVLSASGGIKVKQPHMGNDIVVLVAVVILVGLFSMQHYGGKKKGWKSLGGIMLSITGTEALFADLAHFPVSAIQLAFTIVVFPCLLLAYSGQAAYLMQNQLHVHDAFYLSIPEKIYWPVFIIATLAAVVASQATISATFSIIKQAHALGCFPRVKVVHTSKKFLGQIYVPDMNWILMVLCIAVTAGFKNKIQIGNAYGTAVVIVMLVTTLLMTLIMLLVWHCHWMLVLLFTVLSLVVECMYFSAVLLKVDQGGWVPLVIAAAFLIIMYVWHYGTLKRYEFEMHSKVSMAWILGLGPSLGLVRVPGIGLVYTELASGVPHIFSHFITNLPAIHSVLVFVCVKYLPVYTVPEEERFLVKRIGPKSFHMFRCVARYGYKDLHRKDDDFEKKLFDNLFVFVRLESMMEGCSDSDDYSSICGAGEEPLPRGGMMGYGQTSSLLCVEGAARPSSSVVVVDSIVPAAGSAAVVRRVHGNSSSMSLSSSSWSGSSNKNNNNKKVVQAAEMEMEMEAEEGEDELEFVGRCREAGVVHIMGNTIVRARRESRCYKKVAIDYVYAFLRKMCRENSVIFNVPHESLLNVGQIFSV